MVKIILSRIGKKKTPLYRIVVLDKQKDPWGKSLEILGHYNPHNKELKLDEKKVKIWLDKGAQPSDTMHNLLVENNIIKAKKKAVSTISKKRTQRLQGKQEKKADENQPKEQGQQEKADDQNKSEKKEEPKPAEKKPESSTAEQKTPAEEKKKDKTTDSKQEDKKPSQQETTEDKK